MKIMIANVPFIQRHAGLDLSSRSKGRNIVCAMASVTDNNVCIILKKCILFFVK